MNAQEIQEDSIKPKCNKCDEDGYIKDTEYSRHSCECGWAIEQTALKFNKMFPTIESLFAYGHKRIQEKSKLEIETPFEVINLLTEQN